MHSDRIPLRPGRDDVTLTTYLLDATAALPASGSQPAVLVLPGGGYTHCSEREGEPIAMAFAALGYHAFVLRYSVYGEPDPADPFAERPDARFPRPLEDVGLAMRAIHERAGEWQVDVDRIALCGFSAGGHNAAMYGTRWAAPVVTDVAGEGLRPAALILGYAISDFAALSQAAVASGGSERDAARVLSSAFLGDPDPDLEQLTSVSPARLVDGSTPPTFLWATVGDTRVPATQSLRFAEALAEHGIPHELHVYAGGRHGMALATPATAAGPDHIDERIATWFPHAVAWLADTLAS
ncbi:MAG TPA: alpha/beta hydrolase [Microbacterium sp.]|nr:alpha/beta hydrolase [Microbacterium sp.]